jgi:magnesium-transporting ATPase (P-type)
MQKFLTLDYLYLVPIFTSAILSLKSFRLNWPKPFRIFSVFLISTFLIEIFAISWTKGLCKTEYWNYSRENLWIYNAFAVISHLFFLAYFYHILTNKFIRTVIVLSIVPFLVFSIINYFFIETPHRLNAYTIIIANIITILLALGSIIQIQREKIIINLNTSPVFWIAAGTLVYYSATLPLFIYFNYLNEYSPIGQYYTYINDALNIIMYTAYLIAFLCKPPSRK